MDGKEWIPRHVVGRGASGARGRVAFVLARLAVIPRLEPAGALASCMCCDVRAASEAAVGAQGGRRSARRVCALFHFQGGGRIIRELGDEQRYRGARFTLSKHT